MSFDVRAARYCAMLQINTAAAKNGTGFFAGASERRCTLLELEPSSSNRGCWERVTDMGCAARYGIGAGVPME